MLSKTGILLTLMVFYAVLGLFLSTANLYGTPTEDNSFTVLGINFGTVITNLEGLGWINTILLAPLLIVFGYIVYSSIPTINTGA